MANVFPFPDFDGRTAEEVVEDQKRIVDELKHGARASFQRYLNLTIKKYEMPSWQVTFLRFIGFTPHWKEAFAINSRYHDLLRAVERHYFLRGYRQNNAFSTTLEDREAALYCTDLRLVETAGDSRRFYEYVEQLLPAERPDDRVLQEAFDAVFLPRFMEVPDDRLMLYVLAGLSAEKSEEFDELPAEWFVGLHKHG